MKLFADHDQDEQIGMVNIMRADYDCKRTVAEWVKSARQINPLIEYPSIIVPQQVIRNIAKLAGENWA